MSTAQTTTEYLVSHGRSGALGRFASAGLELRRGRRVVVQTYRGLELGKVLCEATERHRQALPHAPGQVVREAGVEDELQINLSEEVGKRVFAVALQQAQELHIEVLDAEVL